MSLTSGSCIQRNNWTEMPAPSEVIARVNAIGTKKIMPTKLTYANRYGHEIEDTIHELEYNSSDDDDSSYSSSGSYNSDDTYSSDSDRDNSDTDDSNDNSDDDDDEGHELAHDVGLNLPPPPDAMDPNPNINIGPQQQQPHDAPVEPHHQTRQPVPRNQRVHSE